MIIKLSEDSRRRLVQSYYQVRPKGWLKQFGDFGCVGGGGGTFLQVRITLSVIGVFAICFCFKACRAEIDLFIILVFLSK